MMQEIILIGLFVLLAFYLWKNDGDIGISVEGIKSGLKDRFVLHDNFIIYLLIFLYFGNKAVGAFVGTSFGDLNPPEQAFFLAALASFVWVVKIWGGQKIVDMIYDPVFKTILEVQPERDGEFDVLIGSKEKVEENTDPVGADSLAEKESATGNATAYIARWYDKATGKAGATWRKMMDPIDVEAAEENIRINTYLIENEMEEARQMRRDAAIYKHNVKKQENFEIARRWDEVHRDDDEVSVTDLMDASYADFSKDEFVRGVKEETAQKVKDEVEDEDSEQDSESSSGEDKSNEGDEQ